MGVVNITPDSFSDGGRWLDPVSAVDHALRLVEEGAELLDLGAESTRPGGGVYGEGAQRVEVEEEIDRLIPVLQALRPNTTVPISVDTRKGAVAREALSAGADMINDVSALDDETTAQAVADAGCPVVLMHSRGSLGNMQQDIRFENVTSEVGSELKNAVSRAQAAGVHPDKILIDPGIGFGKTAKQNLQLLRRIKDLVALGFPVLVGASRKSFIGWQTGADPQDRLPGSLAAVAWAASGRAAVVRVHDVAETVQFLQVWDAIRKAEGSS